jgi:hypothetical protein
LISVNGNAPPPLTIAVLSDIKAAPIAGDKSSDFISAPWSPGW